jgi:hypothetical protein
MTELMGLRVQGSIEYAPDKSNWEEVLRFLNSVEYRIDSYGDIIDANARTAHGMNVVCRPGQTVVRFPAPPFTDGAIVAFNPQDIFRAEDLKEEVKS